LDLFLQTVINGILLGGIYIVLAAGFSLVFGVLDIIDFAVGEWVMLGAFAAYFGQQYLHVDAFVFLPVVFVAFFALGYAIQPIIFRVVSTKTHLPMLMGLVFTFGLSTLMKGSALTAWGYNPRSLDTFLSDTSLALSIPGLRLFAFVFAVAATLLFIGFLYRTRTGLAIRAAAQDRDKAALMGVRVKDLASVVYGLYAGMTGMAGVLIGAIFSLSPQMGAKYTTFAFFVVVLGGLGYVPGVFVAAILLGLINTMTTVYFNASYSFLMVFLLLFLVLIIQPKGILGRGT